MRVTRLVPMLGWSMSIALHVVAVGWVVSLPSKVRANGRQSLVTFAVVAAARATAPPPVTKAPATLPVAKPAKRAAKPTVPIPVAAEANPALAPAPADRTGVTLAGDEGASWSSVLGNGEAMEAPLRNSITTPPKTHSADPSTPAKPLPAAKLEPPIVPVRDLSSRPVPPSLDAQLVNNYPPEAKLQGLAGRAVVSAQIDADGVVRIVRVSSESAPGFGAACRQTLLGSHWSAPRDRSGNAVNTRISYTCDFRVDS